MGEAVVFSGLGSDALFSAKFAGRISKDAETSAGALLLDECFKVFQETVLGPSNGQLEILAEDFSSPKDLLQPARYYQRNSIIQHSTLTIGQLLRYLTLQSQEDDTKTSNVDYVTGLCAGLLPAVAVATSTTLFEFLSQARKVYRVALLVGIASHEHKTSSSLKPSALFINNISESELSALVEGHSNNTHQPLYISSRISQTGFTLSGTVGDLEQFKKERLQDREVRTVSVNSFYHNESLLRPAYDAILSGQKLEFPACHDLRASIISTADGSVIDAKSSGSLLELVLSWILLKPADWTAVDGSLAKIAQSVKRDQASLRISNYGPGYGAGRDLEAVNVREMTFLETPQNTGGRTAFQAGGDIAVVGMSATLPEADDEQEFWEYLEAKGNSVQEIPESRFDWREVYVEKPADGQEKDRIMGTRQGNFLRNPFAFDASFFNISPREAKSMDPQQRMMLKVAHRALESAGYAPDSTPTFARDTFGCYIAVTTSDWTQNLSEDLDVYYTPGTHRAFLSGRISYFYRWSGPSFPVDSVCSSSLAALNQAVRALQIGDCRAALVGGVHIITSPDMFIGLDKGHFLSHTGNCLPFDANADGYSRAEGVVAVVLKNLDDALAENDRVLGIIKSCEVNHGGNSASITQPHPPTQQKLLKSLCTKSGVPAKSVNVVEAHGTGTQVGDPREVGSILEAFSIGQGRDANTPLYIGSHKGNIGHCEAASGLAATVKMCLMLQHGRIPPQAELNVLNPKLQLEGNNTIIPTVGVDWKHQNGKKRYGVVNNFGAAGSNGALLMEEPPHNDAISTRQLPSDYGLILQISAKSNHALQQIRDDVTRRIAEGSDVSVADLCYTMSARRITWDKSIVASGANAQELSKSLQQAQMLTKPKSPGQAIFVFSGQGSQYLGMGRALFSLYKPFRDHVMYCHKLLQLWQKPSCLDILTTSTTDSANNEDLTQVEAFQTALFVLEVGLARLLMSWGVRPTALAGHSLGEYAALTVAEVLSLEDGLRIVSSRAQLLVQKCNPGKTGMLAVNVGQEKVVEIIKKDQQWANLQISCDNSPTSCVVGGPNATIDALSKVLREKEINNTRVNVPFAFHTEPMDAISSDLTTLAQQDLSLKPARIPVVLTADAKLLQAGERLPSAAYFAKHCKETVRFTESVSALNNYIKQSSEVTWIEIGPHATTLPMVKPQIKLPERLVPSLTKKARPAASISGLLSKLIASGIPISWRQYYDDLTFMHSITEVPAMPYQESDFNVPYKEKKHRNTIGGETKKDETLESLIDELPTQLHKLLSFLAGSQGAPRTYRSEQGSGAAPQPKADDAGEKQKENNTSAAPAPTEEASSAGQDQGSMIRQLIAEARHAPVSTLEDSMSLDELGMDSMMMLEVERLLRKKDILHCSGTELQDCETVGDLTELIGAPAK